MAFVHPTYDKHIRPYISQVLKKMRILPLSKTFMLHICEDVISHCILKNALQFQYIVLGDMALPLCIMYVYFHSARITVKQRIISFYTHLILPIPILNRIYECHHCHFPTSSLSAFIFHDFPMRYIILYKHYKTHRPTNTI